MITTLTHASREVLVALVDRGCERGIRNRKSRTVHRRVWTQRGASPLAERRVAQPASFTFVIDRRDLCAVLDAWSADHGDDIY